MMENAKRVLVTGASGGIGLAISEALLSAGYTVVAHYNRHADALKPLVEKEKDKIQLLQFNVADRENCKAILEKDILENGAYYGAVLSSGICRDTAFPAMSDEDWDSVIGVNLNGFYNVLRPVVMPMCRKRIGRIVTIASVSGVIGNRGQVNYSASKGGIIAASKALAVELASRNITVNSIAPGVIETEMIKEAPLDMILPAIPMRRVGKPEEVAATVVFLLSEGAAYITRQVISVNGGLA